jgi:PAS domain S-box-containing protein
VLKRKDGILFNASFSTHFYYDGHGNLKGTEGIIRDITERKRAEEALYATNETLHALVQCSPLAIIAIDLDGRVTLWNPAAEQMFDWQEHEVLGRILPLISEDKQDEYGIVRERALRGETITDMETHRRKKDGSLIDVSLSTAPLRDVQGHMVGSMAVCVDITQRKQMEAALQESEQRFRLFMHHFPGLAYIKDAATCVLFANQGFMTYLNISPIEILGKTNQEVFPIEFAEQMTADDRRVIGSGQSEEIEEHYGGRVWSTYKFILPRADRPPLLGGFTLDITERTQAEEEIRRLNDELERRVVERTAQLEAAVKELEAFSYSVSHDLRAPLRAIDGFTRILVEDYGPSLDAEGKRVCAVISDNARRMAQLIDDLLAFSRLSRADIRPMPLDMGALAEAAFYQLTTPESRERIEFRRGTLPPAMGDPTLIGQVWQNLLSNALKFSSKRERAIVEVGCQEGKNESVYYVRDNGAGFDMQYAGKLFGVFQRLHSEREFEGTGVGLAIVQRMIHRHGGRIWAESAPDLGATFYFTLG